jgi:hypothetical protein
MEYPFIEMESMRKGNPSYSSWIFFHVWRLARINIAIALQKDSHTSRVFEIASSFIYTNGICYVFTKWTAIGAAFWIAGRSLDHNFWKDYLQRAIQVVLCGFELAQNDLSIDDRIQLGIGPQDRVLATTFMKDSAKVPSASYGAATTHVDSIALKWLTWP